MKRKAWLAAVLLAWAASASAAPAFVLEDGIRLASGTVHAVSGSYPALRVFYIRDSTAVFSAATADGLAWTEEAGIRLSTYTVPRVDASSITGLSIQPITGGFRMLYSAIGSTGTAFRIFSATSADGLAWANDTGTRVEVGSGTTFVGYPSLVTLGSGDWRVYHLQDVNGGNDLADRRVFSALSTNQGRDFGAGSQALTAAAGSVAATLLSDNKVRLYHTDGSTNATVLSALADVNGASFSSESGARFSTSSAAGSIALPLVVRSTDSFRWRLYFSFLPTGVSTGSVFSATTYAPAPTALTPSVVFRGRATNSFAVAGEVFSTTVTAKLTQSGSADIAGTGFTSSNDQNLSGTFDLTNAGLGFWDLVMTNSNGPTGTLTNALYVDFPGGDVRVTDNLFRPTQGGRATIDVTTYNPGRVVVKVYTLNGDLVAALYDADMPQGTTTMTWDGRTGAGGTVASGVYILNVSGPKLKVNQKIVVIK